MNKQLQPLRSYYNKQLRCKRTAGKKGCSRRTRDDKPANPTSKGSTNTRSACPRSKNMETCKGGRERQSKRGKRHVRSWQGCRKQTKKDVSLKAPHSPHSQWLCIPTTQYESQLAQLACIPHMHTTTSKHAGTHEHDTALRCVLGSCGWRVLHKAGAFTWECIDHVMATCLCS